MLTWEDCVPFGDLTDDEIRTIAAHEDIPLLAAVELSTYLVPTAQGAPRISRVIIDDLAAARAGGDRLEELKLKAVLHHFIGQYPPLPFPAASC